MARPTLAVLFITATAFALPTSPIAKNVLSPPPVYVTIVNFSGSPGGPPSVTSASVPRGEVDTLLSARSIGKTAVSPTQLTPCNLGSYLAFDGIPKAGFSAMLCVVGRGETPLGTLSRGALGNWDGAVRSYWPGLYPGFLAPPTCPQVKCTSENFAAHKPWTVAGPAGDGAGALVIYALKVIPDTWTSVHQFAISDNALDAAVVMKKAPSRDFVWQGDYRTSAWQAGNPSTIIGHYQAMHAIGNGEAGLARCASDADCSVLGYKCELQAPDSTSRHSLFFANEKVCIKDKPPTCSTDVDCGDAAGNSGACIQQESGSFCSVTTKQQQHVEYNYWKSTHPDWILYRGAEKELVTKASPVWVEGSTQLMFDFTNREVLQEILSRLDKYFLNPLYTPNHAYSALSLDVVTLANVDGAVGISTDGTTLNKQLFNGNQAFDLGNQALGLKGCKATDGYCDLDWTKAVLTWVERLRDEAHRRSLRLVVNITNTGSVPPIDFIPSNNPELNRLFALVDGVLDESGFTIGGRPRQFQPPPGAQPQDAGCPSWLYDGFYAYDSKLPYTCYGRAPGGSTLDLWMDYATGYLGQVQLLRKPYYTKSSFAGVNGTDAASADEVQWALASYLLAKEHHASLYVVGSLPNGDDGATLDYPQIGATSLGHSCGPIDKSHAPLYTRTFKHGFVVANAGSAAAGSKSVTLPSGKFLAFGGVQYDLLVASPVMVDYQAGLVLSTAATLCP